MHLFFKNVNLGINWLRDVTKAFAMFRERDKQQGSSILCILILHFKVVSPLELMTSWLHGDNFTSYPRLPGIWLIKLYITYNMYISFMQYHFLLSKASSTLNYHQIYYDTLQFHGAYYPKLNFNIFLSSL